jgi:hypothetical protein
VVSRSSHQGVIEAPIDRVWELVGDPRRHPDWLPRVLEVRGDRFETGAVYMQVTRTPLGRHMETSLVIDELVELRSLKFHCLDTGMHSTWLLTPARDETFVEAEFGMAPSKLPDRVFDAALGRAYFRRWLEQSFRALGEAARRR